MFFDITLYISLAVFGLGLFYRMSTWFRFSIGSDAENIPTSRRVFAAARGIVLSLFSAKVVTLAEVFVLDTILQRRLLREDFPRWFMHMCIYIGFTLLLLMHALDSLITVPLFPEYYSTANPFLFLRNTAGALVFLGVAIAVYHRFIMKGHRVITSAMDYSVLAILAVIMVSGFLLEASKIVSYSRYQKMVEEYAGLENEKELAFLEAYWVSEFGVVSPNTQGPFDKETLEQGAMLHKMSCMECHSPSGWAFVSYSLAKAIKPAAVGLDTAGLPTFLWYVHFLACFIGLAYLPFSKMVHIFVSPISLLVNSVMEEGESDPANVATRQVMELDACTHCGICNVRCAVSVAFEEIPNVNILPSEKIAPIKALISSKSLSEEDIRSLQEGTYLCTNCNRCTVACPVGINLQDLWFTVREALLRSGHPEAAVLSNLSFYRGVKRDTMMAKEYRGPAALAREAIGAAVDCANVEDLTVPLTPCEDGIKEELKLSAQAHTFSNCFACKTCTTACPVVFNYDNPQEALGLMPHQIMRAAAMGFTDLIFSSNMLWDCLACYACQEYCPQGVCVTDIFYELKNQAVKQMKEKVRQRA
ncbi:MAG: 4Fe-4S dicluster domain-containing protein [Deltaproteobacteria bacterium]|nr:4Fe-4S dicluster domain-containing protein [Deltaproteobacteria bacterium]